MREFKGLPQYTKDIDGRTVVGICAVFGNVDTIADRIWPGSFTKTIVENARRIKHLWNHNFGDPPIASIKNLQEVGRDALPAKVLADAPEATGGLEVAREYYAGNPLADWVFEAVTKEDVNEMSFGFDAVRFDFTTEGEGAAAVRIRELREVRLFDTSDVNWGMNDATVGSKALTGLPLEQLAAGLTGFLQQMRAGKAGARNAAADLKLINAIHRAAVELGCKECAGIVTPDDGDKSGRAATGSKPAIALSELRTALDGLELAIIVGS